MSNEPEKNRIAGARFTLEYRWRGRDLRIDSGSRCPEVPRSCCDLRAARALPPARPTRARAHPLRRARPPARAVPFRRDFC